MIAADFVYLDRSTERQRRLARFRKRCTPAAMAKVVVWVVMPVLLFALVAAGCILAAAKQVYG